MVMFLLIFLVLRCLRAASKAPDMFGSLICYGVATLFFFQMAVNIGVKSTGSAGYRSDVTVCQLWRVINPCISGCNRTGGKAFATRQEKRDEII